MARDSELEIIVDPDGKSLNEQFDQMLSAYRETLQKLKKAFQAVNLTAFEGQTVSLTYYTKKFSDQLLYLRLNLGRLRAALQNAFAPIGALVLPVINQAINRLVRFLHTVHAVFALLTDNATATDSVAESAQNAAKAYKSLGAAVRRSLAGFDQIERLNAPSGGSAGGSYNPVSPVTEDMQRLLNFLAPLLAIDLTPLRESFARLWEAVKPVLSKLGEAMNWLWHSVLAPFIAWCAEKLFPALNDTLAGAFRAIGNAIGPVIDGLMLLWDALQPVVGFIREAVVTALGSFRDIFSELATQLGLRGADITTVFYGIAQAVEKIWAVIGPILTALYTQFQETFAGIGRVAAQSLGAILQGLAGLSEFLLGVFTGDWDRAWTGILYAMKGFVNSLIGMLNTMLIKVTGALNGMIRLANSLQFKVPDWVPSVGGQRYSLGIPTVTAPQIPYLAKGAVLPANKPFMAVVGDQKHGTNIEAPLAVIQQAVAATMDDYAAANLAGHSATVDALQQILEAVLGIELGDETIGRAAGRYNQKLAIMQGG